jgi:hypothetical protein
VMSLKPRLAAGELGSSVLNTRALSSCAIDPLRPFQSSARPKETEAPFGR